MLHLLTCLRQHCILQAAETSETTHQKFAEIILAFESVLGEIQGGPVSVLILCSFLQDVRQPSLAIHYILQSGMQQGRRHVQLLLVSRADT